MYERIPGFDPAREPNPLEEGAENRDKIVELLADDPAAGPDIAAWCRMRKQKLIASDPPRFLVRRES